LINRTIEPRPGDLIKAASHMTGTFPYVGDSEVYGLYEQRFEKRKIGHMPSFTYQLLIDGHAREFDSEFWTFTIVNSCQRKYYVAEGR
tara:strand:- start:4755 stop:5018 length:264 start_codon:yes stop_codon:yes gene_type:complete